MYLQRPDENTGGSRFLLALSLSTVTALAVVAPLAFKAMTVESDVGGDAEISEVTETPPSSTTIPSGPQIGPKIRSPLAKLPIGPGEPSDIPPESTSAVESISPPPTTRAPSTTAATTVGTTGTTTTESTSTTETTVDSTSTTDSTSSTSTPTTSATTSTSIGAGT